MCKVATTFFNLVFIEYRVVNFICIIFICLKMNGPFINLREQRASESFICFITTELKNARIAFELEEITNH